MKIEYFVVSDFTIDGKVLGAKLVVERNFVPPPGSIIVFVKDEASQIELPVKRVMYDPSLDQTWVWLSLGEYFGEENESVDELNIDLFKQDLLKLQEWGWEMVAEDLPDPPSSPQFFRRQFRIVKKNI